MGCEWRLTVLQHREALASREDKAREGQQLLHPEGEARRHEGRAALAADDVDDTPRSVGAVHACAGKLRVCLGPGRCVRTHQVHSTCGTSRDITSQHATSHRSARGSGCRRTFAPGGKACGGSTAEGV